MGFKGGQISRLNPQLQVSLAGSATKLFVLKPKAPLLFIQSQPRSLLLTHHRSTRRVSERVLYAVIYQKLAREETHVDQSVMAGFGLSASPTICTFSLFDLGPASRSPSSLWYCASFCRSYCALRHASMIKNQQSKTSIRKVTCSINQHSRH
ncbi:hypothetical protein RSAG8_13012, partial [Rhizoctonia solani AG-8 WAC10335]